MTEEKTLSTREIFNGYAVRLRIDTIETRSGDESTREIVEHADAVAVIAVDDADGPGDLILVSQYRRAAGRHLLEIVAGGIEPGEDAETAVRREMQEETGFLPGKVERLGGFYSAPGYCTEYLHVYLATDLAPSRLRAEDTDDISIVRVPVSEVPALLASGRLEDAKSVAGLYMYLERRKG